jgi:small GTP-binding protein
MSERVASTTGKAFEKSFKVVVLGEHATGKTSLLRRLIYGEFDSEYLPTVKAEAFEKEYRFRNGVIRMVLWDTPGSLEEVGDEFFRDARAAIIIYDVCNLHSFRSVDTWYKSLSKYSMDKSYVWLVANKIDLESSRLINDEQVKDKIKNIDVNYAEISAKTGENVDQLFRSMLRKLIEAQLEEIKMKLRD